MRRCASSSTSRKRWWRGRSGPNTAKATSEFLQRVLAAEGLSWRFEHEQDEQEESAAPAGGQKQAKHKVVFFDSKAVVPETIGGAELRFHGVRATDSDDAIDEFNAQRRIQANAVTISSWDPGQLVAPSAKQTLASTSANCHRCRSTTAAPNGVTPTAAPPIRTAA